LRDNPSVSVNDACKALGISRATFYRHTRGQKDASSQGLRRVR
jgi:ACT domain-containing protein